MLLFLSFRLICQWFLFSAGAAYTILSPDRDSTIGNLLNIMLVDNFEDIITATLLPTATVSLMGNVLLGHAAPTMFDQLTGEDVLDEQIRSTKVEEQFDRGKRSSCY